MAVDIVVLGQWESRSWNTGLSSADSASILDAFSSAAVVSADVLDLQLQPQLLDFDGIQLTGHVPDGFVYRAQSLVQFVNAFLEFLWAHRCEWVSGW